MYRRRSNAETNKYYAQQPLVDHNEENQQVRAMYATCAHCNQQCRVILHMSVAAMKCRVCTMLVIHILHVLRF